MTAPDQQPAAYPAPEALYALEVGNYLERLSPGARDVVQGLMGEMSAKDQWELLQSFHLEP